MDTTPQEANKPVIFRYIRGILRPIHVARARAAGVGRTVKSLPGRAREGAIEYLTEKVNPATIGERVASYGAIAMESVMKDILDEQVAKAEHYMASHTRAMEHKLKQRVARGVAKGQFSVRKLSAKPEVRDKIPNLPELTSFTKPEGRLKLRQALLGREHMFAARAAEIYKKLHASGVPDEDIKEYAQQDALLKAMEHESDKRQRELDMILRRGGPKGRSTYQDSHDHLHENFEANYT